MIYKTDDLFFDGMTTTHGADYGETVIGGDLGDVHVCHSYAENGGVTCAGVELHTSIEGLDVHEIERLIREVVTSCYDSIQGDTFYSRVRFSDRRTA